MLGTHLKAKPPFADVRTKQCQQLTEVWQENFKGKMEVILVGDMNDTPDSECIGILRTNFNDIYAAQNGGEPVPLTTHKFRPKEGMVTRTIDYIFSQNDEAREACKSAGLPTIQSVTGIYVLPKQEELPESGYPTPAHPSDHLALGAEFALTQ